MQPKVQGISLIEMLIVISLFSILIQFTLAPLKIIQENNQLFLFEKTIQSAVQIARFESIVLEKTLYLAPIQENDWSQGLQLSEGHPPHILQYWTFNQPHFQLSWHGFSKEPFLKFSKELQVANCNGYFLLKYNKLRSHKIIVNRLGHSRLDLD